MKRVGHSGQWRTEAAVLIASRRGWRAKGKGVVSGSMVVRVFRVR